jgi:uncharacterized OsmC-like protein
MTIVYRCLLSKQTFLPLEFTWIKGTMEVKVKGDISDEQLKTIERLVHYSPVHGMVEYPNKTESKVTRV